MSVWVVIAFLLVRVGVMVGSLLRREAVSSASLELASSRFLVVRLYLLDYDDRSLTFRVFLLLPSASRGARLRPKDYLDSPQRGGAKWWSKVVEQSGGAKWF
tara:strand:- start:1600 stop:1905 length:306 start_codon:yes stop_codon:yes gene_type:complete